MGYNFKPNRKQTLTMSDTVKADCRCEQKGCCVDGKCLKSNNCCEKGCPSSCCSDGKCTAGNLCCGTACKSKADSLCKKSSSGGSMLMWVGVGVAVAAAAGASILIMRKKY